MKKYGLLCTLAVLIGIFLFMSQVAVDRAEGFNPYLSNNKKGTSAPDFTLKDMSGKKVSLSSFKGKPVFLNFWATWCPYCRKERKHLNSLHNDYKDKGLIILSVSTDNSLVTVKRYLNRIPADFIVLSDSDGRAAASYNVGGLPTSFLINREGNIAQTFMGFRDWSNKGSRELFDTLLDN